MRQLVYTMFISNNRPSFVVKEKFGKTSESVKILWNWLSAKFSFAFYVLTNKFVKSSRIQARIFFIFLKNFLKQTWNSFKPNFNLGEKIGKALINYGKFSDFFCYLIALILS